MIRRLALALLLLPLACTEEKAAPPLSSLKAAPLPPFERAQAPDASSDPREAAHELAPAPVFGERPPADAVRLRLLSEAVLLGEERYALEALDPLRSRLDRPVLLSAEPDVYLAQAAPLLALIDDAGVELWLMHPSEAVAYRLTLRDEPSFQEWMAEAKPGKLRLVQRADGVELSTNIGKLPGPDPNGPSIPTRAGRLDIATQRLALERLKARFGAKATDACVLPSFGTELHKIAAVLSGLFRAPGEGIYEERCLVYPRPKAR